MTTCALLLAPLPLAAADPPAFTGTGYLVGVPVPGILCTNAAGQVSLKGNVHVLRVQTDDPRSTGRFQAGMDLIYQADGTALFRGAAQQEVGTWNLSDPAKPGFTPTGGVWDMLYAGVAQADGSDVITLTGYGVGGAIDGLRIEEKITKGPGLPFDPAVPYQGTGTIESAPVTTTVVGDMDGPLPAGYDRGAGSGTFDVLPTGTGQWTLRGSWRSVQTTEPGDTTAFVTPGHAWVVEPGQSLEARVDLLSLDGAAPGAVLALYQGVGIGYWMARGRDYVVLGKQGSAGFTFLAAAPVKTKNSSEVLVLALTPAGPNLLLTARILDKSNAEAVLYETTVVDTPAADTSLSSAQLAALVGLTLEVARDPQGPPHTSGSSPWIGVFQYTDGTLPPAEATFDNLVLRTCDLPQVGVERAVLLSWPAPTDMNYAVEAGPSVHGPWLPVQEAATPGVQRMAVPASDAMKVLRLRRAP